MKIRSIACVVAALAIVACDSPLDTDPVAAIDAGTALGSKRGIQLGLNGAYRAMQSGNVFGNVEMVYGDLYADNLDYTGTFQSDREVGLRNVTPTNTQIVATWASAYSGINRANNLLEAIPNVSDMSSAEKDVAKGESLFIRALMHWALVRTFGDVPLMLEASRGVSDASNVFRTPAADVYAQIATDLEEAANLLPPGRVNGRATRQAANAMLARIYLEAGNYTQARDKATAVIGSGLYSLPAVFRSNWTSKNNTESIFELQYSVNNTTSLAFWYYPQQLGGRLGFSPSQDFVNSFEPNDQRRRASMDSVVTSSGEVVYYGNKYHRVTNQDDNVIILRLAEMYLIRAEANARLNADAATVRADLDIVRRRAGLGDLPNTVTGQAALFTAILQERRSELAFEGHRFFDLRRFGRAESVLSLSPTRLIWPIPQGELDVNPNLTQNDGY